MKDCADYLKKTMEEAGISTQILPTKGYPAVYGEVRSKIEHTHTLLLYGHYDVQPPEPLDDWQVDPWGAEIKEEKIYGRGSADDKGCMFPLIMATKAFLRVAKDVPIHLKFLIEGEEEIGSKNLADFVRSNQDLLKADAVIGSDYSLDPTRRPVLFMGVKGQLYVELSIQTAKRTMTSMYAPIVPNAFWRLAWALTSLKDADENVLIPGFLDDVITPPQSEIEAIHAIPFDEEGFKKEYEMSEFLKGRTGQDLLETLYFQPTCTVSGCKSGFIEKGVLTALPPRAEAKIDFRLVPKQDPEDILRKLRVHLDNKGFSDIKIEKLATFVPARTALDAEIVGVMKKSLTEVYGTEPVIFPTVAGSGPEAVFTDILGIPTAMTGIGPPYSTNHGPNEFIEISEVMRGARAMVTAFYHYGMLSR